MSQLRLLPLYSFAYGRIASLSLTSFASFYGIFRLWKFISKRRDEALYKDAEIATLRESLSAARSDGEVKEETLRVLKNELQETKDQLQNMGGTLANVRNHNHVLGEHITKQALDLELRRDELSTLQEKHTQTLQLLETRTIELRGAEAFLSKADSLSGADVISMLNALNSEIYQTAALVAESFQFQANEPKGEDSGGESTAEAEITEHDLTEVYAGATDILGSRMVELLKSERHHEDPTLVQIAFQAGMSAYSSWILSAWNFEDPDDEHLLNEIYGRLRKGEKQTISGRWRALTRAYVRPNDQEPNLAMYFIDGFVNILLTARVDHQSQKELHELIASKFAERISVIVKGAQTLRKAIGEDITSCDLEIIYVPQDSLFDPAKMDDTFAGGSEKGKDNAEPVLCTTDLGLMRIVKVPEKVDGWEETILLRPKIALQSGIGEIMGEQVEA